MTPFINFFVGLVLTASPMNVTGAAAYTHQVGEPAVVSDAPVIPDVPFYSQFTDIEWPKWRGKSCGIADLAMMIDFYRPDAVSPQKLLEQGIEAGFYSESAGWSHAGLVRLAERYGLRGKPYDLTGLNKNVAFEKLAEFLKEGPVIASVYYKFEPGNPIPHLAVITGIDGDTVYYNDPAGKTGGGQISIEDFKAAWKKRFIVIRG